MSISANSLIFLVQALTSVSAGNELVSAIQNGSTLTPDTLGRLEDAMGDVVVAQNIQSAILGLKALSERDVTTMYSNFSSASTAADVASNVAGGYASGAGRALPVSVPSSIPVTVATPTFSPHAGTYNTPSQVITVSTLTAGATMYYTTNGSTPTTASTLYTGPITVSASETLKVLAVKTHFTNSAIGSAAYVVNGTVATPTFSPIAGSYVGAQMVTVSSTTAGSTFYYTTNGSTPTTASTLYAGPITVSVSETLKVLGTKTNFANSAIASAAYVIS